MTEWTNDMAIQQWGAMPRTVLEQMAHDGDFAKRHLVNPVLAPEVAADGPDGIDAYVHLPNFLIVAARRTA